MKSFDDRNFVLCEVRINTATSRYLINKITAEIANASSLKELDAIGVKIDKYVNKGPLHWWYRDDLFAKIHTQKKNLGYNFCFRTFMWI